MRCPECGKMAAYSVADSPESNLELETIAEENSVSVQVNGTVKVTLNSECCGSELKEFEFELSDCRVELTRAVVDPPCTCTEFEFKAEDVSAVEFQVKRKTQYGYELTAEVVCACGGTTGRADFLDSIAASCMDEI